MNATSATPADTRIVVLPFVNLSSNPENEFLSDGITDEVMGVLARLRSVRVAARASSFALKGTHVDLAQIGRRLNATAVVEGSVRRAGNRLRVTAQLVNIADGFQLWNETYDRELTDILAIQEEIARSVGAALSARLVTPAVLTAHAASVLLAADRVGQAMTAVETGLEVNPSCAALCRMHAVALMMADRDLHVAQASLERAVALDGETPVLLGDGVLLAVLQDDIPRAKVALGQLLKRDDDHAPALYIAGGLAAIGEIDEAFAWLDRAIAQRDFGLALLRSLYFGIPFRQDLARLNAALSRIGLSPVSTDP